jgi:RNA 2',3'-cyclic 3'-phosphodiesterase
MPRLFVAFEVPALVLDAVQEELRRLKKTGADVRWTTRDHLHVTLRFLGEVPEQSIGALEEMLASASARFAPMEIEARGVGTFPPGARPRVVWVGVQGRDDAHRAALHGLRLAVHDGASALGFPTDRDEFRPHLTLGRVKGPARIRPLVDLVRDDRDREFGRFEVGELVLFRSQLSSGGSVYTVLRKAPLGPG